MGIEENEHDLRRERAIAGVDGNEAARNHLFLNCMPISHVPNLIAK